MDYQIVSIMLLGGAGARYIASESASESNEEPQADKSTGNSVRSPRSYSPDPQNHRTESDMAKYPRIVAGCKI